MILESSHISIFFGNRGHASIRWVLLMLALIFLSCSETSRRAPERDYYVEIVSPQTDTFSKDLTEYLTSRIPQKKYTFTNGSGMSWPYYAAFELNEDVPIDSLMPPHWYVHKMTIRDSLTTLAQDDHLVRIDVMPDPDTIPNYRVEIYEMDTLGWALSGSSGIHYIDTVAFFSQPHNNPPEFSSRQLLYDHFLKSIIRYSFK